MPFELGLPKRLRDAGWKVKIRDKERLEPPHVTILRRFRSWRVSLRDGRFLDADDSWAEIDPEVRSVIQANWDEIIRQWDHRYPSNSVSSTDDD
jgi:hypothetical protein